VLGVDELAVDGDVKDAAAALDEFRFNTQFSGQRGLQPGGARKIVSTDAVRDGDVHRTSS